jgi:hypothetical protein
MARRSAERKAAALHGRDRRARGQRGGFEGRLRGKGVAVEPGRFADRSDLVDVPLRMAAEDRLDRRRLDRLVFERLEQYRQPLLRLGVARSRMQVRERRVAQDVDLRTVSASSPSEAPFWARPTR